VTEDTPLKKICIAVANICAARSQNYRKATDCVEVDIVLLCIYPLFDILVLC